MVLQMMAGTRFVNFKIFPVELGAIEGSHRLASPEIIDHPHVSKILSLHHVYAADFAKSLE